MYECIKEFEVKTMFEEDTQIVKVEEVYKKLSEKGWGENIRIELESERMKLNITPKRFRESFKKIIEEVQ